MRLAVLAIAGCMAGAAFAEAPAQPAPVAVTVCELITTPDRFRNKRVEVAGTIVSGIEVSALKDDGCIIGGKVLPMIWLATDAQRIVRYSPGWTSEAFAKARRAAPITRASGNVTWVVPLPVSRMPQSDVDALFTGIVESGDEAVRAVVVGRFDAAKGGLIVEAADGRVRWSPGFGHLGGYSGQIVIESVKLIRKE